MAKTYKYYTSMHWTKDGDKFDMQTQLYEACGVYVAISRNNRPDAQFGYDPKKFGKSQKNHIATLEGEGIVVKLGTEIEVYENEEGYWEEKKNETIRP